MSDGEVVHVTREQLRSRRKREVRPKTERLYRGGKQPNRALRAVDYPDHVQRPVVRGDCQDGPRPCPFVSCKFHLALEVQPNGNLKINFPDLEVWELPESCALDLADQGPQMLEQVGGVMNVTRERVRQIEVKAMARIARRAGFNVPLGVNARDELPQLTVDEAQERLAVIAMRAAVNEPPPPVRPLPAARVAPANQQTEEDTVSDEPASLFDDPEIETEDDQEEEEQDLTQVPQKRPAYASDRALLEAGHPSATPKPHAFDVDLFAEELPGQIAELEQKLERLDSERTETAEKLRRLCACRDALLGGTVVSIKSVERSKPKPAPKAKNAAARKKPLPSRKGEPLSETDEKVLAVVRKKGPIPAAKIAHETMGTARAAGAATRAVNKLAGRGLVKWTPDGAKALKAS